MFMQSLYPGLYLTEVTLDAYKVPEETKVLLSSSSSSRILKY